MKAPLTNNAKLVYIDDLRGKKSYIKITRTSKYVAPKSWCNEAEL